MSATVAGIETELINRFGPKLTMVGMDGTTNNGSNTSIDPSIRRAVSSMGGVLANPPQVQDADVAPFAGFAYEQLLDLASLQLLTDILSRSTLYDIAVDIDQQKLSQLRDAITQTITLYEDRLSKPYGPTMPATVIGHMHKGQHIPNDPWRRRGWWGNWWNWPYPGGERGTNRWNNRFD